MCFALPPLTTQRLRLVPLTRGLAQARLDGDTHHDGVHVSSDWPGDALARLLGLVSSDAGTRDDTLVVLRGTEAIGIVGTKGRPVNGAVEIAYGLVPAAWGRGYATEAVTALVDHLRGINLVVTAFTEHGNTASERVLQKCGFVRGREHPQRLGPPVTDWVCVPPVRP